MEAALQNLPWVAATIACTYAVYKLVRLALADADLSLLVCGMFRLSLRYLAAAGR